MAVSFLATTAVLYVPFLRDAFGFETISLAEYGVSVALALSIIPIMEVIKLIRRSTAKK
jgi:Ca2+-transporting ATPase